MISDLYPLLIRLGTGSNFLDPPDLYRAKMHKRNVKSIRGQAAARRACAGHSQGQEERAEPGAAWEVERAKRHSG